MVGSPPTTAALGRDGTQVYVFGDWMTRRIENSINVGVAEVCLGRLSMREVGIRRWPR